MNNIVVFTGNAHPQLARALCSGLRKPLSSAAITRFSNDCLGVQLNANCREADVFIVQPLVPPVQEHLMELLLMLDAARGASAARITAVIPHYAYARSDKKFPEAVHPIVRTHPVTRAKCLFVNRGFTKRIEGLKKHESDALLDMLIRHCETPEFQCRFRWEKHSIAFWDNRCTQHLAIWDYYPNVRSGYRVQIRGFDPPFA